MTKTAAPKPPKAEKRPRLHHVAAHLLKPGDVVDVAGARWVLRELTASSRTADAKTGGEGRLEGAAPVAYVGTFDLHPDDAAKFPDAHTPGRFGVASHAQWAVYPA